MEVESLTMYKPWNELSISEKSEMMKAAIRNGITNLNDIKEKYNEFAKGGDLPPYSAGKIADALWSSPNQEYLGEPSHHYDFTQSEDWANAHGYYPDNRGHRDDRVKKSSHPSHPSRGNWSKDGNIFNLTDVGMMDPNYIFFGLADGDQDPQASLMYKDTTVLPEITVTPNGNYYLNPYDNYKLSFAEGGPKDRRSNISEILSRMMASKSDVDLKKDNIQPYEEGINSAINSSADNYTVQKGDTLANIAEKITGSKQNYAELAKYNNIDNPDFIQIGQKLKIPEKYSKPLDISEIPTKNRIHIIDDYSPRFNYIVEDDKVYYSQKGKNNHWVDISDNSKARKNLLEHLAKKGFAGYEDDEQHILDKINNNTFDYSRYHDSISNTDNKDIDKYITNSNIQKDNNKSGLINAELKKDFNYTVPRDATNSVINPLSIKTSNSKESDLLKYLGNTSSFPVSDNAKISKNTNNIFNLIEERPSFQLPLASANNTNDIQLQDSRPISYTQEEPTWFSKLTTGVSDFYQLGKNYLERQFQKRINDNDPISTLKLPDSQSIESSYGIIPQTYTGDTIQVNGRRYILPESIDLNNIKLGVRNRGEEKPLSSEGAIITNFNEYKPASTYSGNGTYMGIDKDGNFKVGDLSAFNSDDLITRTYANKVTSFATDSKGNQKWKDDAAHGNSGRSVPIVNVQNEDGSTTEGSINILTSKNKKDDNTYGNITGGRVVMEAGNERRLVSGSIADIKSQFEDMKKRHNADYVTFYTLDNGSYNRGLRTKDRNLTSEDLHMYDRQNSGGGNFMYIVDNKGYRSETLPTPNIRTESDESYKKGHPLVNEKKGIVLHHTAFMEPDLTNVISHLRDPKSEASSHVVIGYNGERKVLADPDAVTFHAGSSVWNNRDNVNDFMLGIEFQGDTNKKDLTDAQIDSAIEYMLPIIRENNIPLENIVTHQQVRDMYNEFAKKQKQKQAPSKPDINFANYEKIINRLKNRVYYKKAFGGPLVQMANKFDGITQFTQQMDRGNQPLYDGQIGFGFGYNPETFERYYTGFYNPYNNSYNNATWTDENGEYNVGLPAVTIRPSGESMVNRAQEKAAPVVRDVLLGSAALAGGIPTLANAASKVPLSALRPGGAFWTNPLTRQMAAGTLVGTASDAASTAITGRPVGKVMSDVINNITGWDPDDNVFSRAAVDMMNPFYYTPYGVASKGVNTAVNVARIASPKYRALHAYNSVNPVGYDNIIKRGKDWLIDMVQDNYVDLKNPKFYRDLVSQANGVRPKFGYTGTGSYLGKNIKNAGQIADEARLDAWAIHNRLAPQYGTYRKNPDGSWSYDMDNIVRKSENTWYPEVAPKSTKKTGALDFVTGAGGGLTDFRLIGSDSKGNGLMHIEDLWDVNPFKRIGDKLTARVFPNLSKKISDKTWSKALNLEVYGLENPDTWAGRVASKLAPKLYKASEKPFLGLLSPIDNTMSKFEIGMVTGGKPFLMKTDIPFHKNPEFGIRFKEMMDDPSKMKFFDTPVYNYGYNPDYIVNLEKAEPMLNFNTKDINWNKLRLTEPVNSVSIKHSK